MVERHGERKKFKKKKSSKMFLLKGGGWGEWGGVESVNEPRPRAAYQQVRSAPD